jgi:hypothetical protein
MASAKFPLTVAEKHKILFTNSEPPAELSAWGSTYEKAGNLHDALEFYQAAGDKPAMERLLTVAVESADLLLFLNTCKALGIPPGKGHLQALQDRARSAGKAETARKVSLFLVTA